MHRYAVHANAQYLGILLLEPAILKPEPGDLVRSAPGEGQNVEGQHNVLLSLVLTQRYFAPQV